MASTRRLRTVLLAALAPAACDVEEKESTGESDAATCPDAPRIVDDGSSPDSDPQPRRYCAGPGEVARCEAWTEAAVNERIADEPWASDHRNQETQYDELGGPVLFPLWVGVTGAITCGPFLDARGRCCVNVAVDVEPSSGQVGRPLRVGGTVRRATAEPVPDAVAAGWRDAGLAEHASIAAFARFVLDLMALGAPDTLVMDAITAQADEVRHARACFALASRGGSRLRPGPLDTRGADGRDDPRVVLEDVIREGCVHETLAAHEARVLSERASDPAVRRVLAGIADDEARHAALAWRTVQWLLATWPELSDLAEATFADATRVRTRGVDDLEREGLAGPTLRAAVDTACWEEVIGPAVVALRRARAA